MTDGAHALLKTRTCPVAEKVTVKMSGPLSPPKAKAVGCPFSAPQDTAVNVIAQALQAESKRELDAFVGKPPHSNRKLDAACSERLNKLKSGGNYRIFQDIERHAETLPRARWHTAEGVKPVTVWCSNDYLGMSRHPLVQEAVHKAVD